MSAVAEKFLAGMNATVTIDGATLAVTDGSYKVETDTDDMTNNTSGGWEEDVKCITKASGSVKAVYVSGTPPAMRSGNVYSFSISIPSGGGISGNVRVKNRGKTITVKGGLKYDFDWKNQGVMTETD